MKIKIKVNELEEFAELNNTTTAWRIYEALPIKGTVNIWGDEIYFSIPVKVEPENPQTKVQLGDIAYWPPGSAFCIFFGPTPISESGEIRPASEVCVIGKLLGDPKQFKTVKDGETIILEKKE